MKPFRSLFSLAAAIILLSCDNDAANVRLNPDTDLSFSGTFRTFDSENTSGTATLQISDGYYSAGTNLPFGYGAGRLEVDGSTINFVDTLFFHVPAMYGPAYVLSGEHRYTFDGENLVIWKEKNVGSIGYKLKRVE